MTPKITWPHGKKFAFSIFDDADGDILTNTKPVYDFLHSLGIHTTKSVWMLDGQTDTKLGGLSCENADYLAWVLQLQAQGFEIGFHNARCESSLREQTRLAIEQFKVHFGHYPRAMSNHYENRENIYWGTARLTGFAKWIYRLANARRADQLRSEGHDTASPYFWGDLCQEKVTYVRSFVFREINSLKVCPYFPYHDPLLPYVNHWYPSAEAGNRDSYVAMLGERNQDQLVAEGGACILYTHFAKKFFVKGKLDPEFCRLMERLAKLGGWFVPVSELLDFRQQQRGGERHVITPGERRVLQRHWLTSKLLHGSS